MRSSYFESAILGIFSPPLNLGPRIFYDDLKKSYPVESAYLEDQDDRFIKVIGMLIRANLGRDTSEMLNYSKHLRDILRKNKTNPEVTQHHVRSTIHLIKLTEYSSRQLSIKQRGEFIAKLYYVLADHLDCASNMVLLKKSILEKSNTIYHYYNNIKLSVDRYINPPPQEGFLFNTLSPYENASLRSAANKNLITKMDISNFFDIVANKVKHQLDAAIGSDARFKRILQVISCGRSGTYFLRTQLLNHSANIVPIHNVYTIPSLNIRSLLSIIQSYALSESDQVLPISKEQLSILAKHVERHLLVFCIELLAYMNRFNKVPVIINHWWSHFAFLLKSILPNLEFISLTRDRKSLMYSMVEKYQIQSNSMPPDIHFSDYEPSKDDKSNLINWSNYFLDITDQLQAGVAGTFPDSCHGSISLTPPNEEAAKQLIQVFNLTCNAQEIIKSPKMNYKEKIRFS